MSAEIIPIRPGMKHGAPAGEIVSARARVEELEIAAVRALAALLRLRARGVDAADMVIDFSGLEAIAAVREMAVDLNAQIDALNTTGDARR